MSSREPAPTRDAEIAARLHTQLGLLLEQAPDLEHAHDAAATLQWLARVEVVIEQAGSLHNTASYRLARGRLGTVMRDQVGIFAPIYNTMAALEARFSPAGSAMFLPAGSPFDSYRALSQIFRRATQSLLIVDRYLDATILTRYLVDLSPVIGIRLLATTPRTRHTESLLQAAARWNEQYPGHRAEVRLALQSAVHDRLVIVDDTEAWSSTQSFKDLADTAPAELVNAQATAAEKIAAYESLWADGEPAT